MAALADQPYTDSYVAEVLRARNWLVSELTRQRASHHVAGGNYLLLWPRRSVQLVEAELRAAERRASELLGENFGKGVATSTKKWTSEAEVWNGRPAQVASLLIGIFMPAKSYVLRVDSCP